MNGLFWLGAEAEQDAGGEGQGSWGVPGLGQATVADGVRLIAGGIENVLQRFRLQVRACCINTSPSLALPCFSSCATLCSHIP